MQRATVLILLMGIAGALSGCRTTSPASSPSVSYEIHGKDGSVSHGVAESGTFKAGENRLELKEGHVLANGKDYGPLKKEDTILLDKEGQLFINGETRPSQ